MVNRADVEWKILGVGVRLFLNVSVLSRGKTAMETTFPVLYNMIKEQI